MRLPWATRDAITLPRAYGSGWHCATDFYSLDFYLLAGTPVYPVAPGRVFQKGTLGSYGNYVMLDHQNGYQSLYARQPTRSTCTSPCTRARSRRETRAPWESSPRR